MARVVDFYDKATEVFNDPEYVPITKCLPDLHEDFTDPIELHLGNYRLTRDKAKDILVGIRPKLAGMVANYELSGAGAGQRVEDNEEYGHVDLDMCVDGDDRRNFIKDDRESYLLYWWHRLDEEDFVQFTICVLDKFHRSNANEFTLVFNNRPDSHTRKSKDDIIKDRIATNMGRVGEGVVSLSYCSLQREIEAWENTCYDYQEKLDDLVNEDKNERTIRKRRNLKKRITSLEEKVQRPRRCALV